jgi:signal transduction histidine kinase
LGTNNGLNLFNRDSANFKLYNKKDGLPSNVIYAICEDDRGNLWISTNKGISKFINGIHCPEPPVFENFDIDDGLQGNTFNSRSCFKSKYGKLYFGGTNGFNVFHPDSIKKNPYLPGVVLTNLLIFNKPVKIGEEKSPLTKHISLTKELIFKHFQSVITIEYAALNYLASDKTQYAFIMEGFEKEWNYVGNKREATYTNLDPGDYTFRVKASNSDGLWNEEGVSIKIIILPPWWQTWWFRISMIITMFASIYIIHRIRIRNIQAHRRELEIKVKERTYELEIAKKETDNILNNVEEGFFLLDDQYKIASQYSSALESIFSTKTIAQISLLDFFKNKIPDHEIENVKEYLLILFDDRVKEYAVKNLNPLLDIEFTFPGEKDNDSVIKKYLNFNFKRIKADNHKIVELIVTVRDVTRQILLSKRLKEEEARREKLLQLMLSILDVEPDMLNDFSESAQRELEFIDKIINHDKIDNYHELLKKVFRSMHLIKGNAKLLNIDYFAQTAHQFEDIITDIQKKSKISEKEMDPLREKLRELQTGIEEMEKIIERLGKVLTHKGRKRKADTRSLLRSLENLIKEFSSDLNKKIKFNYKNFKTNLIPAKYHLLVKEVLIQLVRNSISHGIETPEERKKVKKPQYGIIEISTFKKDGMIGFRLKDDGRGIQTEKLKEKALQSGEWKAEELDKWNDEQLAKLIFLSGITTSDKVDMVAGRGVGMDGVKHRIEELHGDIHIYFDRGKYCEFEITLPVI